MVVQRLAGLSYKELAAVLDVAPGSAGSLLTRAERTFARRYRQAFGEGVDHQGYYLVAVAPAEAWNNVQPIFQEMLDSFRFLQ